MGDTPAAAQAAQLRCLRAGPLGPWFLRETLGIEGDDARALLRGERTLEVVLDRFRLTRFERAAHHWNLEFEFDPPLAQLRRAIGHEDAASARVGLRVSGVVADRFATIGLVRELTDLSLREARRVVSEGLPFMSGLRPAEAAEIVARFAGVGAELEQVIEGREWIAFDPRHAQRGDQPLERARLLGNTLVRERGHLGQWGEAQSERFADAQAAEAACAQLCARWRGQGLALAREEMEVVTMLSPREPTLEASLRADETGGGEAALVYADWLQAHGDPRGQLASLGLAMRSLSAHSEARQAMAVQLQELVHAHRSHLFGPFAGIYERLRPRWEDGRITALIVSSSLDGRGAYAGAVLGQVLALPVVAGLRELSASGEWLGHGELGPVFELPVIEGLRTLCLSPYASLDLDTLRCSRLVRLRRLELLGHGDELRVGTLELPALEQLLIGVRNMDVVLGTQLYNAHLPMIRHFELAVREMDGQALEMLLSAPWTASLRTLALQQLGRASVTAQMLEGVLASPAGQAIEHLDLRGLRLRGRVVQRVQEIARAQGVCVSI